MKYEALPDARRKYIGVVRETPNALLMFRRIHECRREDGTIMPLVGADYVAQFATPYGPDVPNKSRGEAIKELEAVIADERYVCVVGAPTAGEAK